MTSGGQCVMTPGTALMLLWSAGSQDMEVRQSACLTYKDKFASEHNYVTPVTPCVFYCFFFFTIAFLCPGGRPFSNAHFGAGSGPIFLDDVQCTSSSNQLLKCPSRTILSHNCLHSADAGVGCEGVF